MAHGVCLMPLRFVIIGLGILCLAVAIAWIFWPKRGPSPEAVARAYEAPLPAPDQGLQVYHLGHSLVGRDMPAMLTQLAQAGGQDGHSHESQLGWGTSLREHYEPDLPINGFEAENDHPRYRDAAEALGSGDYDAVILTEMVELRDAIRYHKSGRYLHLWAERAREGNPDVRVYLYETWHHLDDPEGWLLRLDRDLERYWMAELLHKDLAENPERPIHVIPAGQVMAAFVRRVEEKGAVGNVAAAADLFARRDDGSLDTIHVNDLGAYLVALTHYAVLYHSSPVGLPHRLSRADGSPANMPDPDTARLMQEVVWDIVSGMPQTGVATR